MTITVVHEQCSSNVNKKPCTFKVISEDAIYKVAPCATALC